MYTPRVTVVYILCMGQFDEIFKRLDSSPFRAKFKLDKSDIEYINKKGMDTIRSHAIDFVEKRLAPSASLNDGKQTPMRGHPVFKAQHACACCCRGCLEKWHKIPKGHDLTQKEKDFVVDLLMEWIDKKYKSTHSA